MSTLYRVFPYLSNSAAEEPGGALYIPPQSGGRIDNPDLYAVLYLSDAAAGAISEAFGRFPEWPPSILKGPPDLPGSARAIARYRLADRAKVCDLDNPEMLISLGLRPSDVVSRDYGRTRAWARTIFLQGVWAGMRWWSYYDSRWASFGVWQIRSLAVEDVRVLQLNDSAVLEASRTIARRIAK